MNILLTGATGFIGQHCLRALLKEGHQVTACCRHPDMLLRQFPPLKTISLDFASATDRNNWLPHLQGIEAVINAVGIIKESANNNFANLHHLAPTALFQACAQVGIKKIIQISALGAELDADTAYFTSKAKADALLQSLAVDWFIFKPSIVFGSGAKSMGFLNAIAALPFSPVIDGGQQELQPLAIEDLQQAVLTAIKPETPGQQVLNAVGAKPIAYRRLLELSAQRLGHAFRPFTIPAQYMQALMPIAACLDEPVLNKQSLAMLQQGNTANADGFGNFLGHPPNDIDEFLQASPASQAERWHARLYFLRPLLNISIAMVWLWAAWVSAFMYPVADSYQLLSQIGITGLWAPLALYGFSLIDFIFGIAILRRWRLRFLVGLQISLVLAYSVVISIYLPEYWLHPFGPLIKNLPFLVATLVLLTLEEERP